MANKLVRPHILIIARAATDEERQFYGITHTYGTFGGSAMNDVDRAIDKIWERLHNSDNFPGHMLIVEYRTVVYHANGHIELYGDVLVGKKI